MSTREGAPVQSLRECRGYGRLWSAAVTSAFGTYITTLAIQVLVVDTLGGSGTDVGLVNAARWLPYLLFGLLAGVLVDRVRRRPVMVTTDVVCALVLAVIPLLAATGHLHLGWVMAAMAVFGTATLIGDAASQSFLPRVVPRPLLGAAHARIDQADAVAQGSGPALAGAVISVLGAPLAVLIDAASYLASAVMVATIRLREPATPRSQPEQAPLSTGAASGGLRNAVRGIGRDVREGLRWVYRHPTLLPFAVSTHIWFACSAIAGAVLAPLALRDLGLSAATFGLATTAAGLGALAGATVAVRLGRRWGAGRVIIATQAGTGLAWAVMATAPVLVPAGGGSGSWAGGAGWGVFAAGQLLLGLCMGASNANEMSYRQTVTPDRLQGRMNVTMRSFNRAAIVVAAPLGGLLGDAAGYSVALVVAATVVIITAAVATSSKLRGAHLGDRYAVADPT
ncbi:MFS transporter [Kineococcus sp. DHX-1]|uniref:MFS transporter n=1 Tax=Kineococcus sp. DHX-1 TaxID=3349638 RepID=UPI0036D4329D